MPIAPRAPTAELPAATRTGPPGIPPWRPAGERLPSFSGSDPVSRGWTKVDGLFWVAAEDAEAFRRGEVRVGDATLPLSEALRPGLPAEDAWILRTDHLQLRTNVGWDAARRIAGQAEAHVTQLLLVHGEALDLRLPAGPLPVLVVATRAEFQRHLTARVAGHVSWGAFYDGVTGGVVVCAEPAPRGALPFLADLRHEMTHQILDLSRPPARRGLPFPARWFWLWEGIALHTEHLGDPAGRDAAAARLRRFRSRVEARAWTPLFDLVALPPEHFEGRHYDQVAVWMRTLLDPQQPVRRARVLAAVRALLAGREPESIEAIVGSSLPQHERVWLDAMARRYAGESPP